MKNRKSNGCYYLIKVKEKVFDLVKTKNLKEAEKYGKVIIKLHRNFRTSLGIIIYDLNYESDTLLPLIHKRSKL